ncbi:cytochrome b5-like heme/steroid binding domain-containing protein [Trueperella pecoris]|uniref:cytochrome b5-like heme/steroid binding domain-containing protein n=1 Tax=Trueperella pecoris TaxID=2733571 RepID=UPI001ABE9CC6|nr:cytochrome b5-like heme/steroid binding domain-containing protein [Trueperella pecoris]QTG75170.1 cytochrome b5 domain-containing protein [Trueperella pecoris]
MWGAQAAPPSTTATTAAENYALDQAARHDNADSCWSAIDGNVYDLTTWINRHPGGSKRIMGICGTDGSTKFNDEHGGGEVSGTLAQFKIGTLTK